ncbi:YkuS family protein [Dethiothermospora halolimnae]|uniref:YkuS family protein n=1 Tax=Dethiothermospora halolimnae TaxID=3114390 RepID=UPI003CCB8FB2
MHKKLAIQQGLDNIKEGLINRGYDVYDLDENQEVEAIIYMADGYNIPYENQMVSLRREDIGGKSAILVNATGKTIDEIDNIIKNKVYSPLFE